MRDLLHRTLLAGILAAATLTAAPVQADLPPPDGTKFVTFHIAVTGLDAHPDHVLLVFPWSLSNGAPTEEIALLSEGKKQPFGRRVMGTPKVWAMRRDAYEAKKEELKLPTEGAIDCGVTINMRSVVPKDAPDELVDNYKVVELGDDACKLELVTDTAKKGGATPTDSTPPSSSGEAPAPQGGSSGCASCTLGAEDRRMAPWPAALLMGLGLSLGLRRRSR